MFRYVPFWSWILQVQESEQVVFKFPLGREVDFTPIMRALQVWASKIVKDLIILIICV